MKQIFELRERYSPQIKELRLLYENNDNTGIYKVFTQWPGCPDLDNYCRIIYDEYKIDGMDFDGGPMIYVGYELDKNNKIIEMFRDKTTNEILIKVQYYA